ncbi:MAG: hypothetical protein HQM10_07915 [Candidatus Riflebacteria bacterium]|nr:hypothetical protein [Candidatus Riflebacteria bacterium]
MTDDKQFSEPELNPDSNQELKQELKQETHLINNPMRLMLATPAALIIFAIAIFADLQHHNPLNGGIDFGMFVAMLYIVFLTLYWSLLRSSAQPIAGYTPWKCGVMGVLFYVFSEILSYPIFEMIGQEKISQFDFTAASTFRLGLVFSFFLPAFLLGSIALAACDRRASAGQTPTFYEKKAPQLIALVFVILYIWVASVISVEQRKVASGKMFLNGGMARKALSSFEAALKANPSSHQALYFRGSINLALSISGNTDALKSALEDLHSANKLSPQNPLYMTSLSMAEENAGNMITALELASQAVSLKPKEMLVLARFAEIAMKMDLSEKSIFAYRKMLEIEPGNASILNNLAFTLLECDMEKQKALSMAKKANEIVPNTPFIKDTLAWAYYKNGFKNEALTEIIEARKNSQDNPEIEFHYIVIASSAGIIDSPDKMLVPLLKSAEKEKNTKLAGKIREHMKNISPESGK